MVSARKHQLDLMRIVFAILVLLSHAPEMVDGNRSRELLSRLSAGSLSFGELAVDGFFLLSGYLIVKSWQRDPKLLNFLQKRLLRIVPGYVVAVLLTVLVAGLVAPGVPHFFHGLGSHLLARMVNLREPYTPRVFPGAKYEIANGSLWTISYEFHCYLLVALAGVVGLLGRARYWAIATVLFLFAGIAGIALNLRPSHLFLGILGSPVPFVRLTAAFMVGGCFYIFRRVIAFRPMYALLAVATVVLARLVHPLLFEPAVIFAGGYLLFYLNDLHLPSLNWMQRFPDISYGIYLYGWTVEEVWLWYHPGHPWIAFLASTAICVVLGWLSWHFIERPALTFKLRPTAALPAA